MAELGLDSSIRDVLGLGDRGRELLFQHGYDVGTGFVDLLSQRQTLRDAVRAGRLRDAEGLLQALNRAPGPGSDRGASNGAPSNVRRP